MRLCSREFPTEKRLDACSLVSDSALSLFHMFRLSLPTWQGCLTTAFINAPMQEPAKAKLHDIPGKQVWKYFRKYSVENDT